MKEEIINILSPEILKTADAICFTSNGIVKNNGELVMGAGVAKSFATKWKGLPAYFGEKVKNNGNVVHVLSPTKWLIGKLSIVSFPTKHHWKDDSDINLIIQSAKQLVVLAAAHNWKIIYLPRPGSGLGGLNWERDVRPAIKDILDDRFIIASL
jgi:hypothetical protein